MVEQTLNKYKLNNPFILSVGKQEPRKNIKRLIKAFTQTEIKNIDLVVVGPLGWDLDNKIPINRLIGNAGKKVKYLGLVSEQELVSLYQACLFFVYPSLWEGFGYPIIEAMQLGVPVATANTSSMKEIGKAVALLFNPEKTEDIKNKLSLMIENKKLRIELSKKGRERAKEFTWEKAYEQIISSFKKGES